MCHGRMFRRSGLRILTLTAALAHATVPALADCNKDAMLVFDGSASMVEFVYEPGRGTRIAEARLATAEAIPAIALTVDTSSLTALGNARTAAPASPCASRPARMLPPRSSLPSTPCGPAG